jgi:hypothetical protein
VSACRERLRGKERTEGCPELLALRKSSPGQWTRRGINNDRGTSSRPWRSMAELLWCTRGARQVLGFCECASAGGGRASGVRTARNGQGGGGHGLGVRHGCRVHGVRAGGLGAMGVTGGVHERAVSADGRGPLCRERTGCAREEKGCR